jgi:hypothetical protein
MGGGKAVEDGDGIFKPCKTVMRPILGGVPRLGLWSALMVLVMVGTG